MGTNLIIEVDGEIFRGGVDRKIRRGWIEDWGKRITTEDTESTERESKERGKGNHGLHG